MALVTMTADQWAQLGLEAGLVVAARRRAEATRLLQLQGAIRLLEQELQR